MATPHRGGNGITLVIILLNAALYFPWELRHVLAEIKRQIAASMDRLAGRLDAMQRDESLGTDSAARAADNIVAAKPLAAVAQLADVTGISRAPFEALRERVKV